jgi:Domain of unknown function (DUF5071)
MDAKSFVPRHKCDLERANRLQSLDETALHPIAADLLEWLQDMNWPVAGDCARALMRVGQPIIPLLRDILQGSDETWKHWCILCLIRYLPIELAQQLRPELSRIVNHPSETERSEGVEETAREALAELFGEGSH